jgi:hypothetical protein
MTTQTAPKFEAQHPPLARDALGNLLAIPDGTCAWRILRETTGRPREIRGPDKQPFRFPLETTGDELVEMCGSGVYRVYALDEVGGQLAEEHVARWDLTPGTREPRNGAPDVPMLASLRTSAAPAATTDLRFALEAMTQMMRTNSDALRIVSESHVDLAKTIATAKGLPRNAAYMLPPAASVDDDDDEEEDAPPPEKPRHFVELLMPLAQEAAKIVPALVAGKMIGGAASEPAVPASTAGAPAAVVRDSDEDLANRPSWEARDLYDLRYAGRKAEAKRAAKEKVGGAPSMKALQDRIMADTALLPKLMAIKAQLSADEIETLLGTVAVTTEAEQTKFLDAIKVLPVEEAVVVCRDVITAIREQRVG